MMFDMNEPYALEGEEMSLYHVLKMQKRKEEGTIYQIQNNHGTVHTAPLDVNQVFVQHLQDTYENINVHEESIRVLVEAVNHNAGIKYEDTLHDPITQEELRAAIRNGGKYKAPGSDGISAEFFRLHYDILQEDLLEVINQIYMNLMMTPRQKHGILLCLPKHRNAQTPADFRPIILLNTVYKQLARIIANRLTPMLEHHLATFQYCGVPQNTIMDAVSTIRDAIAHEVRLEHPYAS
jgi:hypothetical protein